MNGCLRSLRHRSSSRLSYNSYDPRFGGQKAYDRRFSGLKNKGEMSYFFITQKALRQFSSFFGSVIRTRKLTLVCKNYHRHSSVNRLNMMINEAFYNAYDSRFSCLESLQFQKLAQKAYDSRFSKIYYPQVGPWISWPFCQ